MAFNVNKFSNRVFKVLKGNGLSLQLYTDEGKKTIDPEEARRFYNSEFKIMVNIISTDGTFEVQVNIPKNIDMSEIKPIIKSIKNLASRSIATYTLRTFGRDISPKDFAYQAKNTATSKVAEGLTKTYGSKQKSYQKLEDAKIIIQHKKTVDEEVRGARSRNIKSIFIENGYGERFLFPHKNLTAARAMCRHVKEGGTPYDEIGSSIISLSEEYNELKRFKQYANKNSLVSENTSELIDGVAQRMDGIKKTLSSVRGARGYSQYVENFSNTTSEVDESELEEVKNKFTVSRFDEDLSGALPHVARVAHSIKENAARMSRLSALRNKVEQGIDLRVSETFSLDDPDSPENREFSDPVSESSALAAYLSTVVLDPSLSETLHQLADDIPALEEDHKELVNKFLTYFKTNAKVVENKGTQRTIRKDSAEPQFQSIEESFNKFGFHILLSDD